MYEYNAAEWLLIFYIYCFLGWCFESTVVSVQQRRLVNRGFLHGPMLPIYGFGATIMLHVALPLHGHPVQIFFAGMVVATIFEYLVGCLMEWIFHVKYWDYSEHRFQFQGRICLQSSIAWGVLSLALPYVLHRPVEGLLEDLSMPVLLALTIGISVYFAWDVAVSVRTALNLAKLLEEMERMRTEVGALREQLEAKAFEKKLEWADAIEDTRDRLADAAADVRDSVQDAAESTRQRLRAANEQSRLQIYLAIQDAEDQITDRVRRMKRLSKWTVRGNPTLHSDRFNDALEEIKRRLSQKDT